MLGEGPVWDAADGTLLWIDILADRVHRSDLSSGATMTIQADRTVGAIAPRADGGLIAAVPGGFGSLGRTARSACWRRSRPTARPTG